MSTAGFPNTPEQDACVAAARDTSSNLMVQAYAGCAKTYSLVLMSQALPAVPSLALVFNAKNKREMEGKFPKHFDCRTLNGLGHGAWSRAIGKRLVLNDKKLGAIISGLFSEVYHKGNKEDWSYVLGATNMAMQVGLVPKGLAGRGLIEDNESTWSDLCIEKEGHYDPLLASYARETLIRSIRLGLQGEITYNDQIYLSALFGGVFPKFPLVMVDEAQDLSSLNHIMLAKTCKGGRLIVVGDEHQAIYGWRGAAANSMALIRNLKNEWTDLTLSQTFRCPQVLVIRQHHHVPEFRAAPSNPQGVFFKLKRPQEIAFGQPFWSWKDIQQLREAHSAQSVAILCRNNSPLFTTAFCLIRQGIGCVMLGRDIGKALSSLLKKIVPEPEIPLLECIQLITTWMESEVAKARATGNDDKVEATYDRGQCLLAVADSSTDLKDRSDLLSSLDTIFSNTTGLVQLSTIHRYKGLESDMVIHLDPWRVPSKRSLDDPEALVQELNLKYVCETRARLVLVEANADDLLRS